ncbi:TIR domain-containing protein [Acetobacter ascendens]|uniref:TIR domain-containing protein n=1 Tax=Acetobacter ascendens TaxID=481146 RepID=UPI0012FFA16F|nr:TIR domain-containing protein [Acetobacter ascendens]
MEKIIRGNIFLSHSSSDKEYVEKVYKLLDPTITFYDIRTIQPGQETIEAMESGIKQASVFVLFHSNESRKIWVDFEKSLARLHVINNTSVQILVCPINGSNHHSLPPWMTNYMTTSELFLPNDIARSIKYLYEKSLNKAYPETIRTFPGREVLQRKITLSLMRASAATGEILNAMVLTGLQGMGRGTIASAIVNDAYQGMRCAGPVFEMPASGEAIDWHLKFFDDLEGGLSEDATAAQIAAFKNFSVHEQAKTLVSSLKHWGDLNQVITIRHRWGLRDKGNRLAPWFLDLMQQLKSEPNIRLILISERQLPSEQIAELGNLQQFSVEELDSDTIQFILTERIEPRYLDPQKLPLLAEKINGHPATANHTAYLINGGKSIESLIIASGPVTAFQDKVLGELFDLNILSEIQKKILKLLCIFPQIPSSIIASVFKSIPAEELMRELWDLVEFSVVTLADKGKYKVPAVVASTYRRRSVKDESDIIKRVGEILKEQFDKNEFDFELIDSLIIAIVSSGQNVTERMMNSLTPAKIEPVIEKEYYEGLGSIGDDARVHFDRCYMLAQLAMTMNAADYVLESMLFYGADASVRLGNLPEKMLTFMEQKGFIAADYVRASFLFYVERDLPKAAQTLQKSVGQPGFKIRNVRLLARIYLRDGEFRKALETLEIISESRLMRDTGLVLMKVKALRGVRNRKDAEYLLSNLNEHDDDYGDLAIYQASKDIRNAKYPSAIEWIKKARAC